jgi:Domain of unknown function (DUF4282)
MSTEHDSQGLRAMLSFDTLITPRIIAWLYALLLLAALAGGVATLLDIGASFPGFASALVIAAARVLCELLLVLFKINEHMQAVSKRL